jgi:protein phosphatase
VGAAAEGPRRSFGLLRRRPSDTGELEPVPGDDVDPEALRYAPREPRRFVWGRRLGIAVLAVALVVGLGIAAYAWTQTQYYVGPADRRVAVYKGVEAGLPGLRMHHVVETSDLRLDRLPAYNARQVRDGIGAQSLADAHAIIDRLRGQALCPPGPTPSPTLTPSPTGRPTVTGTGTGPKSGSTSSHKPRGTRTSTRHRTATAKPSSTATAAANPSSGSTGSASGTNRNCTERP